MAKERQPERQRVTAKDMAWVVAAIGMTALLTRRPEASPNQPTQSRVEDLPSRVEEPIVSVDQPLILNVSGEEVGFPNLFYQVQSGETLSQIAQRWGTTVEHIAIVNGISDPSRIEAGQLLRVVAPLNAPNIIIPNVSQKESNLRSIQQNLGEIDYRLQREADLYFEGIYYYPGELDSAPKRQSGLAHLYGLNFQAESLNQATSSGQPFDPTRETCASWFYPIGSIVRVFYNGRSVECLVNDRGPNRLYRYEGGETKNVIIDLSVATARAIEPNAGVRPGQIGEMTVSVELVSLPENWLEINSQLPTTPNPYQP